MPETSTAEATTATVPEMAALSLGTVDYIVVVIMLLVSSGIGVYFRFSGGKQRTTHEFLMAGRNMAIMPVAFSVMASGTSAITYLGIPSEMYVYGTHFAFTNLGVAAGAFAAGYLMLPVFFKTGASTTYEYLEKRYGKLLRRFCSLAFSLQSILYIGVILYAPALAISAVTEMPIWISVVAVGVVCTFYCTLGGMKAVLWTDVFQALLMYAGLIAIIVKGNMDVGGLDVVVSRALEKGRLVVPGLEMDFTTRYTFINTFLNGFFIALSAYGASQTQVQRLLTLRNVRRSRCALFSSVPMNLVFQSMNCFAGLVIYAYFFDCDPLTSEQKAIFKSDQLLPYFSLVSLGRFPGLPGLCVCGVLSAALSTMSSIVNSLTTVTVEDFIRPSFAIQDMSEKKAAFLAKIITLAYGSAGLFLTFIVARFGNVLQASTIVYGLVAGPTLGVFLLGVLTSRTNEKGAIMGLLISFALTAWISIGGASVNIAHAKLPVSTAGCPTNVTGHLETSSLLRMAGSNDIVTSTVSPTVVDFVTEVAGTTLDEQYVFPLYRISYMWFTPIGVFATLVFGYICSFLFSKSSDLDKNLLSPMVTKTGIVKGTEKQVDIELTSATSLEKNSED